MSGRFASLPAVLVAGAMLVAVSALAQDPGHVVQGEGGLITALVIDPSASSTLYATTARGLYKTTDGGRTWLPYGDGLGTHSVLALAVDPASRGLFAATDSGGVFRSADGAGRWSSANNGLAPRWIGAVAFDPNSRGVVYVGTEAGRLFRSVDGGHEWSEMKTPIPQVALSAITVDPADSNVIHVGTNSEGIFRTADGGLTWTRPTDRMKRGTVWNITIDPTNPSRVYVGTHDGLFRSSDRGLTWSGISKGMKSYNVLALTVDPSHPDTLYAATAIGIYKSPDSGATWALLQGDLYVSALVVDPRNPTLLYAGTHMGVIKSTDGGTKWMSLDFARRKDDTLTAGDGTAGPLPSLPVRSKAPAAPGLRPLPIRPPSPPVHEAFADEPASHGDGAADVAPAAPPATVAPVPVARESAHATIPEKLPVPVRHSRPANEDVAGARVAVMKTLEAGTKRVALELAQSRDAAIKAVDAAGSIRPNPALHRAWAQATGLRALPAAPLHRVPAMRQAAAAAPRGTRASVSRSH